MRSRRLALVVVLAPASLAGCGAAGAAESFERPSLPATAQDQADVRAWDLSEDFDEVRHHHDAEAMVAEVVSGGSPSTSWADELELLSAEGATGDEDGARIDVRLLLSGASGSPDGDADGDFCYRYVVRPWGVEDHAPHRADCGDRAALPLPDRAQPAVIPVDAEDVLTSALGTTADGEAPTAGQVQDAVEDLAGQGASVTVVEVDGAIGVGVSTPDPARECLLARRTSSGEVEVWQPDAVLVAPGESSCDGATAAAGGAQGSPH